MASEREVLLALAARVEAAAGPCSELDALIADAKAAYEALSPVDRALADADQRRSFIRGMAERDPGPDVLAEEVRRLRAEVAALRARARECE